MPGTWPFAPKQSKASLAGGLGKWRLRRRTQAFGVCRQPSPGREGRRQFGTVFESQLLSGVHCSLYLYCRQGLGIGPGVSVLTVLQNHRGGYKIRGSGSRNSALVDAEWGLGISSS